MRFCVAFDQQNATQKRARNALVSSPRGGGQEREVFERENAWETNNAAAFLSVERSGCRRVRICSQAVALVPF